MKLKLVRKLRGMRRGPKNEWPPYARRRIGRQYTTPDQDAVPLELEGEPPVAETKGWGTVPGSRQG